MDNNQDNNFDEAENFDRGQFTPTIPVRHGCVTAWLIIMLIANSIISLVYLARAFLFNKTTNVSFDALILLGAACLLNVIFAVMLLSWKKTGFYGFVITAIIAFIININIGISPLKSLFGLAGIGLLYAILQIKQDGVSAWNNLK